MALANYSHGIHNVYSQQLAVVPCLGQPNAYIVHMYHSTFVLVLLPVEAVRPWSGNTGQGLVSSSHTLMFRQYLISS